MLLLAVSISRHDKLDRKDGKEGGGVGVLIAHA